MTAVSSSAQHVPVMSQQVLDLLTQAMGGKSGLAGIVVDGTVGHGYYAKLILERLDANGRLYCFDRDPEALQAAEANLGKDKRLHFVHDSYAEIEKQLEAESVGGILLDLGLSTEQIQGPKGFSYMRDSLLDMRFDPASEISAYEVVNHYSIARLRDIFFKFGEEPLAPRVARRIAEARQGDDLKTTRQLAQVIKEAVPARFEIKTLARIFQAIRIEVNGEIEQLERGLEACWRALKINGILCAISYHSIESRRIKRFFAAEAKGCICPPQFPVCACGKKPSAELVLHSAVRPSPKEIRLNPAARSALLRAARKIGELRPNAGDPS